jgi:hypothetical protein
MIEEISLYSRAISVASTPLHPLGRTVREQKFGGNFPALTSNIMLFIGLTENHVRAFYVTNSPKEISFMSLHTGVPHPLHWNFLH